jgi:hypothetical protein
MTWNPPPVVCESCEGDYHAGRVCPQCGTETCAHCGWCDECAAQTVTFTATPEPAEWTAWHCDAPGCPGHATPAAVCEELTWTGAAPDDPAWEPAEPPEASTVRYGPELLGDELYGPLAQDVRAGDEWV